MAQAELKALVNSDRRLVNFLICGTQKGGTSALYFYLREHPEICMAQGKEVHYFDNEYLHSSSIPDYSIYHSVFHPNPSHKLIGEATPIYMYWHEAPKRIWRYNPHMKLIVILRNPIDRAYSHWNMERSRNKEPLPFWDAIRHEEERCREALPYQHRIYSYVDRGFYLEQLRRLWFYFTKENVLALKTDVLMNQSQRALDQVCTFLGITPFEELKPRSVHTRAYSSRMTDREKDYLRVLYEHEIKGLERFLHWDCSDWLCH